MYMLAIHKWGFIFGLLGAGSQLECDCNMGMLFPAPAKGSFHRAAANHPHHYPLHHNDNNNNNDNNDDDNTIYIHSNNDTIIILVINTIIIDIIININIYTYALHPTACRCLIRILTSFASPVAPRS